MDSTRKISICVPVYDMENGEQFFERCLDSILSQRHEDFEVVVTDNSSGDKYYRILKRYGMPYSYSKNPHKGACVNTNEAIKNATGEIIKIIHMDDFFADKHALQEIVNNFKGGWLVTGCLHTTDGKNRINPHYPSYNDQIHTGNNTIGSPSVLAFENNAPLMFDEGSVWLFDCDYYKRLYKRYGKPTILNSFNVVIGLGSHQMTEKIGQKRKDDEVTLMKQRYETI